MIGWRDLIGVIAICLIAGYALYTATVRIEKRSVSPLSLERAPESSTDIPSAVRSLSFSQFVLAAAPTPLAGAMTVYAVTNLGPAPLDVSHMFTNTAGFRAIFTDTLSGLAIQDYHLRDMSIIPSPFTGTLLLTAASPFTASVSGYDYWPTATPTASPTPRPTNTATPSPTATKTSTATPTATPSPTATATATPTAVTVCFEVVK